MVEEYIENLFYIRWENEQDKKILDNVLETEEIVPRDCLEIVKSYVIEISNTEILGKILEEGYEIEPIPVYSII